MRYTIVLTIFLCFLLSTCLTYAQDSTVHYSASIQAAGINGETPFWLRSNQFGAIPESGSFVSGQWSIHKLYNTGNPRFFQWSGGAQLITNVGKSNKIFFTDLFLSGKAGAVEITLGQRRDLMGLMDSTLTSGSIAMSGNFRPYPKIQISTPNFVNIIPLNDAISVKFSYSDGLLGSSLVSYGNTNYVPNVYMHQKSLYLRVQGFKRRLVLYGGFNHQAMWGGEDKIFTGGLKTWEAYKYVVLGKGWAGSRVGNHFGTIDFGTEWKGKNWNLFLYRQSIYEDGSLAKLTNIADGLNGFRIKRSRIDKSDLSLKLNSLLFEFIYTKEQGGSVFDFSNAIFGNDNYFNHYIYPQGWSYRGLALGTPLVGPQAMYRSNVTKDTTLFTNNNRIIAFHLGSKASWNNVEILLKATFSKNFGTYNSPLTPSLSQSSILLRMERPTSIWNNSLLNLSLAADFGKLYPNNSAITIGWRKVGLIR